VDDSPLLTVAVLGAGSVGRALAAGWVRAGHRVLLGSREPASERMAAAVTETGAQDALVHRDAARAADVAVVAVPAEQVESLVGDTGDALRGRVAIDTTNVLTPGAAVLHHADVIRAAGATVFRAFNTVGWEQMAQPVFGAERCDLLYAGPEGPARGTVERLVGDLGFRPVWLGDGEAAFASTDALARVWFQLAFERGWGRRLGFRLLSAEDDPPVA
jgi:8-hydroxy-5-deazaflavin:NADPH oxidoreductase